jgi:hypothetical protein
VALPQLDEPAAAAAARRVAETITERAVLHMVALGVPAAQAARFGYAGGWLGRPHSALAE